MTHLDTQSKHRLLTDLKISRDSKRFQTAAGLGQRGGGQQIGDHQTEHGAGDGGVELPAGPDLLYGPGGAHARIGVAALWRRVGRCLPSPE